MAYLPRDPSPYVLPDFRKALLFMSVAVSVVVSGMLYYSQILDCPAIIAQRGEELKAVQREKADAHDGAATSCVQDRKLLTALTNFRDARSTCTLYRMSPRESWSAPTRSELYEIFELRQKVANACAPLDGPGSRPAPQ